VKRQLEWAGGELAGDKTEGTLKWNQGVNNEMVYITGNIPSGTYDANRLANLSFGFWGVDVGGPTRISIRRRGTSSPSPAA
jgi:hypothetical protein